MASPGVLRARCDGQSPRFASVAVGVGQVLADVVRFWNCAFLPGLPLPSLAVGVGRVCAAWTSENVCPSIVVGTPRRSESVAVAVGHKPEPFAPVRGANGCR